MPPPLHSILRLLLVCLSVGLLGCVHPLGNGELLSPLKASDTRYQIHLEGDEHKALLKALGTELERQRANNRRLQQFVNPVKVARYQRQLLEEKLRAEGYYAAKVELTMTDQIAHYRVQTGPRYTVRRVVFKLPASSGLKAADFDIKSLVGAPLLAQNVLDDIKHIEQRTAWRACLLRVGATYKVDIYHETRNAKLTYRVKEAPVVNVGEIRFEGLDSLDESYLRNRIQLSEGQCFSHHRIDQAKLDLFQTNLLAAITPQLGEVRDGRVDVTFQVQERRHRTLSAGIVYQSDDGAGVTLGWEHRNILGKAQKFEIDSLLAENKQSLNASLGIPQFLRNNRALRLYTSIVSEQTEAFDSDSGTVGAELTHQLSRRLRASLGSQVEFARVVENDAERNFALVSLPMTLEFDRRDALLDPRQGFVITGRSTPFWDAYESSTRFVKSTLAGSAYVSTETLPGAPTLALRAAVGSISGVSRDEVPANVRFYAGGGGSVRGFPYQSLGPMTEAVPNGGMSFREVSLESRFRISESWGAVLFIDGGFAYENKTPAIDEEMLYAWGLGLRFFTSFAPIRVDVAFPFERREGIDGGKDIDDPYQLYVSIGQAF